MLKIHTKRKTLLEQENFVFSLYEVEEGYFLFCSIVDFDDPMDAPHMAILPMEHGQIILQNVINLLVGEDEDDAVNLLGLNKVSIKLENTSFSSIPSNINITTNNEESSEAVFAQYIFSYLLSGLENAGVQFFPMEDINNKLKDKINNFIENEQLAFHMTQEVISKARSPRI